MWKAPNRPNNVISQTFNDGMVTVYAVTDTSNPGYKPQATLTEKETLYFAEQRLGIQRYYNAKQNQINIDRVIRTMKRDNINSQDVAVINGVQYRIDLIQNVMDIYPPCIDITLSKIEQTYQISSVGDVV